MSNLQNGSNIFSADGSSVNSKSSLLEFRKNKGSSDIREHDVIVRRQKRETLQSIADLHGITRERVRQIDSQVKRPRKSKEVVSTEDQIKQLKKIVKSGEFHNMSEIARMAGLNKVLVSKLIKSENIEWTKKRRTRISSRKLTLEDVYEILVAYSRGRKISGQFAKDLGVSSALPYQLVSGRIWGAITGLEKTKLPNAPGQHRNYQEISTMRRNCKKAAIRIKEIINATAQSNGQVRPSDVDSGQGTG